MLTIRDLSAPGAAPTGRLVRLSRCLYRPGLVARGAIRRASREEPAAGPHQGRRPPPQLLPTGRKDVPQLPPASVQKTSSCDSCRCTVTASRLVREAAV